MCIYIHIYIFDFIYIKDIIYIFDSIKYLKGLFLRSLILGTQSKYKGRLSIKLYHIPNQNYIAQRAEVKLS